MHRRLAWSAIVYSFALAGLAQGAPIHCTATSDVPLFVPPPSGLAADMMMHCALLPSAPGSVTVNFDVSLFVNTNVTSQVINPDGSLESVLLINEPDPGGIIPGTNAFYAKRPPGQFSNQLLWADLSWTFDPGVWTVLRLSSIRVDAGFLASPSDRPNQVIGFVAVSPSGTLAIDNPQQIIGFVEQVGPDVPEPAPLVLTVGALLGLWLIGRSRDSALRN